MKSFNSTHYFKTVAFAVSLGIAATAGAIPTVYVNAATGNNANAGDTPGTAVQTITEGINKVDAGGTVNVAAGTYTEQVTLNKQVKLLGANAGISPTTGTRVAETILSGVAAPVISIVAGADGSQVDGLRITGSTGENDTLAYAPISGWASGTANVTVRCNQIDACVARGISGSNLNGWTISDNKVTGITGVQESGMYFAGLTNCLIAYNTINNTTYAGIILDSCNNVVVTRNTISNLPQPGVQIANTVNPVTISNNTITQCNSSNTADKAAITMYVAVTNLTVTGNTLSNNFQAFATRNQAGSVSNTVHVNQNNITGNTGTAVKNNAQSGGVLDAKNNWWGNASGPAHPTANPTGTGDSVSDNVDFSPWLTGTAGVADWAQF